MIYTHVLFEILKLNTLHIYVTTVNLFKTHDFCLLLAAADDDAHPSMHLREDGRKE